MPESVLQPSAAGSAAAGGVFVGVDWGNAHHQLCVLDAAGRIIEQGKVMHDVAGLLELTGRLGRHTPVAGIAIERSEGLLVETPAAAGAPAVLRVTEDVGSGP